MERQDIQKKCCRCWAIKDWTKFWIDRRNPDGLSWACGECTNKKRVQLWRDSPEDRLKYIYNSIVQRCNNPKTKWYKNYWWRWIKCLWKDNNEFVYDMIDSYDTYCRDVWWWDNHKISIDRIDNNGNYCKENCRRTNQTTQIRNKRCTRIVEWKPIQELSDIYNIPYHCIWSKIKQWLSLQDIIDIPNKRHTYWYLWYPNMTLVDIAKKEWFPVYMLYNMKHSKWWLTKEKIYNLIKKYKSIL